MTARERIDYLLDEGSFQYEIGAFAGYEMYEEHGGCPAAGVVVVLGYIHKNFVSLLPMMPVLKRGLVSYNRKEKFTRSRDSYG